MSTLLKRAAKVSTQLTGIALTGALLTGCATVTFSSSDENKKADVLVTPFGVAVGGYIGSEKAVKPVVRSASKDIANPIAPEDKGRMSALADVLDKANPSFNPNNCDTEWDATGLIASQARASGNRADVLSEALGGEFPRGDVVAYSIEQLDVNMPPPYTKDRGVVTVEKSGSGVLDGASSVTECFYWSNSGQGPEDFAKGGKHYYKASSQASLPQLNNN